MRAGALLLAVGLAALSGCGDTFRPPPVADAPSGGGGSGGSGGAPPGCGNGQLDDGEACDDDNTDPGDGCRPDCTLPECEDGVQDPGEVCFIEAFQAFESDTERHQDLAIFDCDGDGDLDLATADLQSNTITVHRNDDVADFSNHDLSIELPGAPVAIVAGQLRGDELLEVAIVYADRAYLDYYEVNDCEIGVQSDEADFNGNEQASDLVAADIDGDGMLDLVATLDSAADTPTLAFVPFDADGAQSRDAFATTVGALAAGDLDGDGDDDIAYLADVNGQPRLLVRASDGVKLEADNAASLPLDGVPLAIAIGEMTGDDRPDIVVADDDELVTIIRNDGRMNFSLLRPGVSIGQTLFSNEPQQLVLADVDVDGDLDVVTANADDDVSAESSVSLLLNVDGTLVLADSERFPFVATSFPIMTGRKPYGLALGDLNGDGALDIATASDYVQFDTSEVSVLLQSP